MNAGDAGVPVTVELVLFSARGPLVQFRVMDTLLSRGRHPDAVAADLADEPDLLHSTSWRYQAGGIVLTYAALPDRHPREAVPLGQPRLAVGADPRRPSPVRVDPAEVATHAARHLAFLHRNDPTVSAAGARHPVLWDLLTALEPAVAGLINQPT